MGLPIKRLCLHELSLSNANRIDDHEVVLDYGVGSDLLEVRWQRFQAAS